VEPTTETLTHGSVQITGSGAEAPEDVETAATATKLTRVLVTALNYLTWLLKA
jgi:uncharacterized membrane protein YadS